MIPIDDDLETGRIPNHEPGVRVATNASVTATQPCEPPSAAAAAHIQILIVRNPGEEEDVSMLENKQARKKKAPKPPRPPQGPSLLDAADLKLVKEISALASKKRARKERIKALKKMKEAKSPSSFSSSNGWISALVIAALFFLVILFQGFRSRGSSSMTFQGSPEPAVSTSWMSVQFYGNPSANEGTGLGSESPSSSLQQNSGSEFTFPG